MKLSLAQPNASHYDALSTWISDAEACVHWAGPGIDYPFSGEALPQLLQKQDSKSFSLTDAEEGLMGFGQYWPGKPGTVHLGRIIINPLYRGQGLGKALLQLLIAEASHRHQPETITLNVLRDNPRATFLYRKMGFVPHEDHSTADMIFMQLDAD
ncbi:GNAT family N-acetyltransferase [uncultured Methylophaga sp.]|jgi:ribosomal protein S18 acetylase RimI-like enzyme|uniref:GNAT family N-acetyltransferase n=1 Tax=uncultured Methylophaga sp. TaxID=285271 RepID=UPI002605AD08|nr:GNAT family N-acetyltransferase [uncultured Methylophaga sp.]